MRRLISKEFAVGVVVTSMLLLASIVLPASAGTGDDNDATSPEVGVE